MKRVQCFNIGEAIFQILTADPAVSALVGSRISPVVAPEGTEFPYIVYSCASMSTAKDKDSMFYQQDVFESIIICTETYEEGIDILTAVGRALQFEDKKVYVGRDSDSSSSSSSSSSGVEEPEEIDIMESALDSRMEDYVNNVFVQGTVFHLKIR